MGSLEVVPCFPAGLALFPGGNPSRASKQKMHYTNNPAAATPKVRVVFFFFFSSSPSFSPFLSHSVSCYLINSAVSRLPVTREEGLFSIAHARSGLQ